MKYFLHFKLFLKLFSINTFIYFYLILARFRLYSALIIELLSLFHSTSYHYFEFHTSLVILFHSQYDSLLIDIDATFIYFIYISDSFMRLKKVTRHYLPFPNWWSKLFLHALCDCSHTLASHVNIDYFQLTIIVLFIYNYFIVKSFPFRVHSFSHFISLAIYISRQVISPYLHSIYHFYITTSGEVYHFHSTLFNSSKIMISLEAFSTSYILHQKVYSPLLPAIYCQVHSKLTYFPSALWSIL